MPLKERNERRSQPASRMYSAFERRSRTQALVERRLLRQREKPTRGRRMRLEAARAHAGQQLGEPAPPW